MQDIVNSDVTLTVDMGSFHIWIARYLYSFRARQVMISNGQQTMGVARRGQSARGWSIRAAKWSRSPATAGSCNPAWSWRPPSDCRPISCISSGSTTVTTWWRFRNRKYQRLSGVEFGPVDFKAYAESFGAKGFAVASADALEPTLRAAMDVDGPAVVAIPVDYRDNPLLMGQLHLSQIL